MAEGGAPAGRTHRLSAVPGPRPPSEDVSSRSVLLSVLVTAMSLMPGAELALNTPVLREQMTHSGIDMSQL